MFKIQLENCAFLQMSKDGHGDEFGGKYWNKLKRIK
jgi:hypothetical protein